MKIVLTLKRPEQVTLRNLTSRKDRLGAIARQAVEQSDQRHCVVCGCTDNRACPGGCSWAMLHQGTPTGVCSKCWGPFIRHVDQADMDIPRRAR